MEVSNIETTQNIPSIDEKDVEEYLLNLPLDNDMLSDLQLQDTFCANILAQIEKGNIIKG